MEEEVLSILWVGCFIHGLTERVSEMSVLLLKIVFNHVVCGGRDVLLVEVQVLVVSCESGVAFFLEMHDLFKVIPV